MYIGIWSYFPPRAIIVKPIIQIESILSLTFFNGDGSIIAVLKKWTVHLSFFLCYTSGGVYLEALKSLIEKG